MSRQIINVGTHPNDHTGDFIRDAMIKSNANFEELYSFHTGLTSGITVATFYNANISLTSAEVSNLGTPKIIIPGIPGYIIHLHSGYVKLNVITPLNVNGQDLIVDNGQTPVILTLDTTRVQHPVTSLWSLMQPVFLNSIQQSLIGNQPIRVYFSEIGGGSSNPTSGDVSMDFFITLQLIYVL